MPFVGVHIGVGRRRRRRAAGGARIYPLYPFDIPGIDYPVGRTSTNPLKIPGDGTGGTTAAPAGVSFGSLPRVIITGADVTMEDWDFRGLWVDQTTGTNTTINQCVFDNSGAAAQIKFVVQHKNKLTMRYNDFFGVETPASGTSFVGVVNSGTDGTLGQNAELIFEFNYSEKAPQSHIYWSGGTIRYNHMTGVSYVTGAHGNCVLMTRGNVPSLIAENYFDMLPCPDPVERWSFAVQVTAFDSHDRLSTPGNGNVAGLVVENNLMYGGSRCVQPGDMRYLPMAGVVVRDNWLDTSHANCYGTIYPDYIGATISGNVDALTGAPFTEPPGQVTDLAVATLSSTSVKLIFTAPLNAETYQYSHSPDGVWQLGAGLGEESAWATLAGDGIVSGVTDADTRYWRVVASRAAVGDDNTMRAPASDVAQSKNLRLSESGAVRRLESAATDFRLLEA